MGFRYVLTTSYMVLRSKFFWPVIADVSKTECAGYLGAMPRIYSRVASFASVHTSIGILLHIAQWAFVGFFNLRL
jgi:hypothetical protein